MADRPEKLQKPSLVDQIYEALFDRITQGGLTTGERLVIDRLARDFGVSLIPVREALARLQAERLVVLEANRGYRVAPKPDRGEVEAWREAREMIETYAVRLAARRMSAPELAQIRRTNQQIRATVRATDAATARTFMDLNDDFHRAIVTASGNPYIQEAYDQLHYGPQMFRITSQFGQIDLDEVLAEHEAILAALAAGDPDRAAAAMSRHIVEGLERWQRLAEEAAASAV